MSNLDNIIHKYTRGLQSIPDHMIVEMARYELVRGEWNLEILTVKTGDFPRRLNIVRVKDRKKWMIRFDERRFDFSQLNGIPSEIVTKIKRALSHPQALKTLNTFWLDPNEITVQDTLRILGLGM